jgi:phosphoesterase RecJ-like protein
MLYHDPQAFAPAFTERLSTVRRPLLLTHLNPDGDAIGSLLGMWHALRLIGKQPLALAMPPLPNYALWLPGIQHMHIYRRGEQLPDCDLIIMLDTATVARTGAIAEEHGPELAATPLSIIDHHVTNGGAGSLDLVQPAAASTCELLQQLFDAMGIALTPELATCLLLGLTTDTQSFQTRSTTSATLRSAARLIDAGAEQRAVVQQVYNNLPASTIALVGRGLSAMRCEAHVAWTTVTQAMLAETGAEEDAIDEVVRAMQRLGDIQALVLFKERADGTTKLSLRARPPLDVAQVAQRWGGGGHSQASGANLAVPPEQAAAEVVPVLQAVVAAGHTHKQVL